MPRSFRNKNDRVNFLAGWAGWPLWVQCVPPASMAGLCWRLRLEGVAWAGVDGVGPGLAGLGCGSVQAVVNAGELDWGWCLLRRQMPTHQVCQSRLPGRSLPSCQAWYGAGVPIWHYRANANHHGPDRAAGRPTPFSWLSLRCSPFAAEASCSCSTYFTKATCGWNKDMQ